MKFYELVRAFFRKMVQMCSNFVTTCTIRGTRGAKLPADATFSGRSMVEMLGVLAIIGVLSVGAIAGYSKAMMKYKLNKQTEQISTILNNLLFESTRTYSGDKSKLTLELLIKLGDIPEDMIGEDNISVYDVFHNRVYLSCDTTYCRLQPYFTSKEECFNLVLLTKEYREKLFYAQIWTSSENSIDRLYGDTNCHNGNLCLKDLSVADINKYCTTDTFKDNLQYSLAITFYNNLMP